MEFAIYGKLSEAFLLMRDAVYWLFPSGIDRLPLEEDAKKQVFLDRYTKSGEAIEKAQTVLGSNAPFIPAEFYADFEEISMDFFSGSATTAHAVMQLNSEDSGNRQYILVQLPELCDEKSEA